MNELTQELGRFLVTCMIIAAPMVIVIVLLVFRQVHADYEESRRIKEQQGDDDG